MNRVVAVLVACAVWACATTRSSGSASDAATPAENLEYAKMAVAAASQIQDLTGGRSVGMYRANSDSPILRDMVKTVIEVYGFTEVKAGESKVTCGPAVRSRTKEIATVSTCRIDVADVLLQLNALQVTNDSGYVGGLFTEVPLGGSKMHTTAFCLIAVREKGYWMGSRHSMVDKPRDCAVNGKH